MSHGGGYGGGYGSEQWGQGGQGPPGQQPGGQPYQDPYQQPYQDPYQQPYQQPYQGPYQGPYQPQPGQPADPGGGGWGPQQPPQQPQYPGGEQWAQGPAPGQPPADPSWGQQGQQGAYWQGQYGDPQWGQQGGGQWDAQWGQQGWGQPAPPSKSNKGLLIGLTAGGGGLAVIVVLVLVFVFLKPFSGGGGDNGGGGDGGQQAPDRKVAWTLPIVPDEKKMNLHGTYVVDNTLVRVTQVGLVAYDLATGKQKWKLTPPNGSQVCAASPTYTNKVAGIVFGKPMSDRGCDTAMAIDLTTGKQVVGFEAKDDVVVPGTAAVAAANGKVYAAAINTEAVFAIDIKAQDLAWAEGVEPDGCSTGDVMTDGSGVVLAVAQCMLQGGNYLVAFDAETGKISWKTEVKIKNPISPAEIVSVSPPVVHVAGSPSDPGELHVFDESGTLKYKIPAKGQGGTLAISPELSRAQGSEHPTFPVAQVGTMLIALTVPSEQQPRQKIVGLDLATGQRAWAKPLNGDRCLMADPTDPKRVALVCFYEDKNAQLFTVNPQNGTVTPSDTLARPKANYLMRQVRFIPTGKTLLQVRTSAGGRGPLVIAYRAK